MPKRAKFILHIVIPLLLVFCTPPAINNFGQSGVRSLEQASKMAHFAPDVMDSAIGVADLVQRENYKSSDRALHDVLISDRVSLVSTTFLVFILSFDIGRFANKIGLKAIAIRAPPCFIFK